MKEEKLLQEAAQKASEILWKVVGTCIILATFVAVLFYMQQQKAKEAQMGHVPVYVVVSDEKAYREIAWDYAVESDIVYAWTEGKNGTEELLLDVYRTAKEGLNPGAKAAYEWVLANGESYGIDIEHIALGGYSSGADISINLCYSNQYSDFNRENLFAVIDISGSGIYYSMTNQVVPGCVIVHGTEDTTVRFSNSEKVESKLTRQGIDVKFYPLEGMNHDLLSRYDEVRNTVAEYLYQRLTGNEVTIDIKAEINPEYQKVLQRMENDMSYEVQQLEVELDGILTEWEELESIDLIQLKDAGEGLPSKEDFNGQVKLAWNKANPTKLYIAAKVQDDEIKDNVPADGKWYQDDCLELVFDTSTEQALQQLTKWVIGVGSSDLSVLATADNTMVATSKNGNETSYEICIDISKVPEGTYQGDVDISFAVDKSIGFSIAYNDSEGGDRQHQVGWTPGKSSDRTTLGTLYFK